MVRNLSKQVTWCGAADVPEARENFGSVLCVAENVNVPVGPTFVPYFSLPHNEHELVRDQYFRRLLSIINFVSSEKMLPLLIHCRSGHHRSPTVAAMAEAMINSRPLEVVLTEVTSLWPDYEEHRKGEFAQSLLTIAAERFGE